MTFNERSVHPDLLEEELAAREGATVEEAPPRARSVRGSRRASPDPTPADQGEAPPPDGDDSRATEGDQAGVPQETPEWFSQARDAFDRDPEEAFKLLAKNLPRDRIERDETLSGLIGSRADLRARELLRQQERDAAEQAKLEAARNNDLYTLGELSQREMQERIQQADLGASGNFMDGVVLFQQSLPESIQNEVAGRTFGAGKGQAAGVAEYLAYISDARIKLKEAELEREYRNRESALRKSVLSEVNGDEPVPEREGGTPGRVREVTDEQVEAMSMDEYNALFDENGHPKPGVRHRKTRGIPLRQH